MYDTPVFEPDSAQSEGIEAETDSSSGSIGPGPGLPAHVDTLLSYTYVREEGPGNQGEEIDMFLASTGLDNRPDSKKGYPYCAAAVSYSLEAAGASHPDIRDARSRAFRPEASWTKADLLRGDKLPSGTITIHRYSEYRGHVGLLERQEGRGRSATLHTVEANTSCEEGGQGVCRKTRTTVGSNYLAPVLFADVRY